MSELLYFEIKLKIYKQMKETCPTMSATILE
jgi:hypothetical protein